jgi:membrane protein DedA with SNARE-associated domain
MGKLVLIALSTLISEDLACIAAAGLIAGGMLSFFAGALACFTGIFVGDLALFGAGRLFGRTLLRWPLVQKRIWPADLDRASDWLMRRGFWVVFLSRFTPGLRLPTYFAAGLLRTNAIGFTLLLVVAASVWTPVFIGAAVALGARTNLSRNLGALAAVLAVACLSLRWLAVQLLDFRKRRRLWGASNRWLRWEFWPSWAAYSPVLPYFLWLAWKHRSFTIFTAANPGIFAGGICGESKSQILDSFVRDRQRIAVYACVPRGPLRTRISAVRLFIREHALAFPIVLKPDTGERGRGVAILHSWADVENYLRFCGEDAIVQRYVPGLEFGIFYHRVPGALRGKVTSITQKHFPTLLGDGQSTVEELILKDSRAVCLAKAYLASCGREPDDVPRMGEPLQLVEIGSHCRGAVFLDARRVLTPALQQAVDHLSKQHTGFFFGRYDVRTPSVEAFRRGEFTVIELNGVTGEPGHIYDPSVSLLDAYRALFVHWRRAFLIGAANVERGARPLTFAALLALIRTHLTRPTETSIPKHILMDEQVILPAARGW